MNNKQLRTYLLCAFLPAWALQVLASHFALQGKAQIFQLIMIAVMFVPLIAALLAGVPLKDLGWKPELRKNKGALAAAWARRCWELWARRCITWSCPQGWT